MPIHTKHKIKPSACQATHYNGTRNKSITSSLARIGLNVVALLAIAMTTTPSASAAQNMHFSVDATQVSLDISVPATSALQLTPTSDGSFGSTDVNVGVGTSWSYGYTLTMMTESNNTSLTGQNTNGVIETLPAKTGGYTTSEFSTLDTTMNKYGVNWSFNGNSSHIADGEDYSQANYLPVATSQTLTKTNTNSVQENTTLTFGAKLNSDIAADSYGITLVFAVTPNAKTTVESFNDAFYNAGKTTVNGFYAMQDMTPEICANVPANQDKEGQLIDRRDNKVYWVAKLKDGKCWMTQGLDLDLSENTALSYTLSDIGHSDGVISRTWTPVNSTEDSSAKTITIQTTSSNVSSTGFTTNWNTDGVDKPHSTDPGDRYVAPTRATTTYTNYWDLQDAYYNSLTACNAALASTSSFTGTDCTHYQLGNFYNFAAATATNSVADTVGHTITNDDNYTEMPDSICPANWRLPHGLLAAATNGTASDNNSEFDTLLYAYNVTNLTGATASQALYWNNSAQANGYTGLNNIRTAPLYFARPGLVDGGTLYSAGVSGHSWSSTISATSLGYYFVFRSTEVYPALSYFRYYGFPVRCVAR